MRRKPRAAPPPGINDTVRLACSETEDALKYATAVEELQGVRTELAALRGASSGADWVAIRAERDTAAASVHELDLRASTTAGELGGLQSVRP